MKVYKVLGSIICLVLSVFITSAGTNIKKCIPAQKTDSLLTIPIGGNSWRNGKDTTGGNINNNGIVNWTDKNAEFITYVRVAKKGRFKLWLNLKVADGKSQLTVTALKTTKQISVTGNAAKDYYVGEWALADTGYIAFKIKGINKTGLSYADVSSIKLSGPAINAQTTFVKNNEGEFFYWGRRGPSVHLGYNT
jgi:hypothetical protein